MALLLASCGFAAAACQGTEVEFEEAFNPPDPSWGANGDRNYAQDGKAFLKADPNGLWYWVNPAFVFDNVFGCVTTKTPELKDAAAGTGGLVFWYENGDKYYIAAIKADGKIGIWRHTATGWVSSVPAIASTAIKTGTGAENTIEVEIHGNKGTLFVNGTKITDFRGQPPKGGSSFGLYSESEKDQANIWEFSNLRVATAPAP
ncbi:MAG: hypothetical protein J0H54_02350 [Rhizobiales bacterium]|nr:hypothetical protein [Hyphomicrobiales bacterium]